MASNEKKNTIFILSSILAYPEHFWICLSETLIAYYLPDFHIQNVLGFPDPDVFTPIFCLWITTSGKPPDFDIQIQPKTKTTFG